jgi:hypothetical protein
MLIQDVKARSGAQGKSNTFKIAEESIAEASTVSPTLLERLLT